MQYPDGKDVSYFLVFDLSCVTANIGYQTLGPTCIYQFEISVTPNAVKHYPVQAFPVMGIPRNCQKNTSMLIEKPQ